ncbi:hypothetical protein KXX33_004460 [Aspergillus fumigatus]|nr:hypothetical protein KXX45_007645 [Aspergillus fumigatus]KAH1361584.1 hypothetical protein KXX33_004460 [Aspergillus fumigatus]KAH1473477.1 hypothetical protein KXX53_007026 [Aspergillus fumigatus]KAH1502578.1 hypothetical protein KXX52_007086 [Aspergillus fumigatus]KAH1539151.1 hypothetical protein KXX61_007437 [Aspergillus fumigatus]
MGRTMLVCLVGSITAFSVLTDLAISITFYRLRESASNGPNPTKCSSLLSLSAVNFLLVSLLSYLLYSESEPQATEWILRKFKARALFCLIIFLNIGIITGERLQHLYVSKPKSSSSSVWLSLNIAHAVVWTISAYCQGFLCALSFVLPDILNNESGRASNPPINIGRTAESVFSTTNLISPQSPQWRNPLLSPVPSFLDPLPSPQSEMSVRTSILRSPLPNYCTCKDPEPLFLQPRRREKSLQSTPSIDTVIRCPESNGEMAEGISPTPTPTTRKPIIEDNEKNIRPLFRPSTPHLSPMPNMSTAIIAPLEGPNQVSVSVPCQRENVDPQLSSETAQPVLPFYVLNATARNSLAQY